VFNVVLIEPEIPPNTGNIGRLCLATRSTLHLVKPLGFSLDDRELKRAGLDYWNEVDVQIWDSFQELQRAQVGAARYFFLTTKSRRAYYDVDFRDGDFLVFGRETKGLPESLLAKNQDACVTISMYGTRSLNLATAVAIVLFEAVRQQR
jgi:tRNA (cytidine/uridine-2'-O-)-methyltransferase